MQCQNNRLPLRWISLFLFFLAPFCCWEQGFGEEFPGHPNEGGINAPSSAPSLSPGASEVAQLLHLQSQLDEIQRMNLARQDPSDAPLLLRKLLLRQEVLESIVSAGLEADGVLAELENEVTQTNNVRVYLESRRDHRIGINTLANIISGGVGGVAGQLVQINHGTAGSLVGAGAGAASTLLSLMGLRQQRGDKQSLGVAPNMLAKLLGRTPEFHSDYPEIIWSYLNAVPPGEQEKQTRREKLIQDWIKAGLIDEGKKPKDIKKIDLLTSSLSHQQALSIDLLSARTMMLNDVRSRVYLIKRDLGKLMLFVRSSGSKIGPAS